MNEYDQPLTNKQMWLTREEAANYLGVTANTLAVWACEKRYLLPMVKIGRRVQYKLSDLNAFVEQRTTHKEIKECQKL